MASPSPSQAPANLKLTTIDLVGGIYCSLCHLTFRNKQDYDTHYYKHNLGKEEIVYTCVICHKDIAGYPSFRGHCYTNHVIKDRFKLVLTFNPPYLGFKLAIFSPNLYHAQDVIRTLYVGLATNNSQSKK